MPTEEENRLILAYQQGDQDAGIRVVQSKLPFIYSLVEAAVPPNTEVHEAIAEGVITAIKALRTFEPGRGVYFSAYIKNSVSLNVSRAARKEHQLVHLGEGNETRKIARNLRRAREKLYNPTVERLAEFIGVPQQSLVRYLIATKDLVRSADEYIEGEEINLEGERARSIRSLLSELPLTESERMLMENRLAGEPIPIRILAEKRGLPLQALQQANRSLDQKIKSWVHSGGDELRDRALSLLD